MATPPSPNPTPLPALAMVAALVFAVGAIAAVFVFDRDPELFRSRGSTAVSHRVRVAGRPGCRPAAGPHGQGRPVPVAAVHPRASATRSNDAAINDARRICTRYAGGESEQQIIQDILQGSPGMTLNTASGFADTAISVYCPDGDVDQP